MQMHVHTYARSRRSKLTEYANLHAYQDHINTPPFQKYKTATLHMVKSLKL